MSEHVIHFEDRLYVFYFEKNGTHVLSSLELENVTNYCLCPLEFRHNKIIVGKDHQRIFAEQIVPMVRWVADDENLLGLWSLDMDYDSDVFDVERTFHLHFSFSNIADLLMFKFKFA